MDNLPLSSKVFIFLDGGMRIVTSVGPGIPLDIPTVNLLKVTWISPPKK